MIASSAVRLAARHATMRQGAVLTHMRGAMRMPCRTMSSTPYQTVSTPDAPSAIGPYSQAVVYNGTAYVSGCIPFDPKSMQLVEGGIEAQAQRALDNLKAVVKASGSDVSHILKVNVYKPARSAVEVARLPKDVGVEIECIAAVPPK